MQRPMFVLFALCGLLWPSVGHSQDEEVQIPSTNPDIRLRYAHGRVFDLDTLFVDWSTVYAKTEGTTSGLQTGTPAEWYELAFWAEVGISGTGIGDSSLVTGINTRDLVDDLYPFDYEGEYAQVRRDTILFRYRETYYGTRDYEFVAEMNAHFSDGSVALWGSPRIGNFIGSRQDLLVRPDLVREDAGPTTIEVKAQWVSSPDFTYSGPDIHITPIIEKAISLPGETYTGLGEFFNVLYSLFFSSVKL